MRSRIALAFVPALAALALTGAAAARHTDSTSTTRLETRRAYIATQRRWAWQWQDRAGVRRWPTKYLERHARTVPALHWLARLWHQRHRQAQQRYLRAHRARTVSYEGWAARQIAAAEAIARSSGGDPWPNCPDPYDGGGSWQATVDCENGGNWLDSPGFYRCGLQFDPHWETVYGRLCP